MIILRTKIIFTLAGIPLDLFGTILAIERLGVYAIFIGTVADSPCLQARYSRHQAEREEIDPDMLPDEELKHVPFK